MRVGKIAKIFGGERQNFEVCVHFKLCAKDEFYAMKVVKSTLNRGDLQKYDF